MSQDSCARVQACVCDFVCVYIKSMCVSTYTHTYVYNVVTHARKHPRPRPHARTHTHARTHAHPHNAHPRARAPHAHGRTTCRAFCGSAAAAEYCRKMATGASSSSGTLRESGIHTGAVTQNHDLQGKGLGLGLRVKGLGLRTVGSTLAS